MARAARARALGRRREPRGGEPPQGARRSAGPPSTDYVHACMCELWGGLRHELATAGARGPLEVRPVCWIVERSCVSLYISVRVANQSGKRENLLLRGLSLVFHTRHGYRYVHSDTQAVEGETTRENLGRGVCDSSSTVHVTLLPPPLSRCCVFTLKGVRRAGYPASRLMHRDWWPQRRRQPAVQPRTVQGRCALTPRRAPAVTSPPRSCLAVAHFRLAGPSVSSAKKPPRTSSRFASTSVARPPN